MFLYEQEVIVLNEGYVYSNYDTWALKYGFTINLNHYPDRFSTAIVLLTAPHLTAPNVNLCLVDVDGYNFIINEKGLCRYRYISDEHKKAMLEIDNLLYSMEIDYTEIAEINRRIISISE